MSAATILLKNEVLKTRRRFAFLVTLFAFSGITFLMMLERHMGSLRPKPRPFSLPHSWWGILEEPGQIGMFFVAVILVLLIATEFSWRTARQNVIDGLSKEQFFLGKLMLLPLVAGVVLLAVVLIGGGLALLGEGPPAGGIVYVTQLELAGAILLAMIGFGSFALLLATTVRNSGPALGLFILYVAFAERIGGALLNALHEGWGKAAAWFPSAVFQALVDSRLWSPALRAAAAASPRPGRLPAPPPPDAHQLLAFAAGYIVLFVLVSFLVFRQRDL